MDLRALIPTPAAMLLIACSPPPASQMTDQPAQVTSRELDDFGRGIRTFAGPGYVCGLTFAITLEENETLTSDSYPVDFLTYVLERSREDYQESMVIYEGNHPQSAEVTINTGRDFPDQIALHEMDDPKVLTAEAIRERIAIDAKANETCVAQRAILNGESQ